MPLDYETVLNCKFDPIETRYSKNESILYALGIGLGDDPVDAEQLKFVYEKDLLAFPTMPVIFGYGGTPTDQVKGLASIDYTKLVYSGERLIIHNKLPPEGDVICETWISEIFDKGLGRGAILVRKREVYNIDKSIHYATLEEYLFVQEDGGFGREETLPSPPPHVLPEREPDHICDLQSLPQSALIYRLSGDKNILHVDPDYAAKVGFDQPLLHGLCSFGMGARAVLQTCAGMDASRLKKLQLRFMAPVYPGDAIRFDLWQEADGKISFRAKVQERDAVVLDNGLAILTS